MIKFDQWNLSVLAISGLVTLVVEWLEWSQRWKSDLEFDEAKLRSERFFVLYVSFPFEGF